MKKLGICRHLLLLFVLFYIPETLSFRFEVYDKGNEFPSILMDIEFTITVTAFRHDRQIDQKTHQTSDAQFATLAGSNGTTGILMIQFQDSFNWEFKFQVAGDTVYIKRSVQFIPSFLFPESSISSILEYRYPRETNAGRWTNSYECDKTVETNYIPESCSTSGIIFKVKTSVRNFKTQAFNVINGLYSPVVHCNGDTIRTTLPTPKTIPTTTTTTTKKPKPTLTLMPKLWTSKSTESTPTMTKPTTITTTTAPGPTVPTATLNTYIVHDEDDPSVYCIVFVGKVEFEISYVGWNSKMEIVNQLAKLGIPGEFTVTGKCKGDQQRLNITFNNDWFLTLIFAKAKSASYFHEINNFKNESKSGLTYSVANVFLSYAIDTTIFPNTVECHRTRHFVEVTKEDSTNLPTKHSDKSYCQCIRGLKVRLGRNVMVKLSLMKFKAFNNNGDLSFQGKKAECKADIKPNYAAITSTVFAYIALGIFGILALIVIVTLVVTNIKKRRRTTYEPIS